MIIRDDAYVNNHFIYDRHNGANIWSVGVKIFLFSSSYILVVVVYYSGKGIKHYCII